MSLYIINVFIYYLSWLPQTSTKGKNTIQFFQTYTNADIQEKQEGVDKTWQELLPIMQQPEMKVSKKWKAG